MPYTFTSTALPAETVLAAIPISPVVLDVPAFTAREADDTVVKTCSRLMVLPLDV